MGGKDEAAALDAREVSTGFGDGDPRAERQGFEDRQLHVRRRIDEGAVDLDAMRRRGADLAQRIDREIADIAIAIELDPAPAFVVFIEQRRLAIERLRVDGRIV